MDDPELSNWWRIIKFPISNTHKVAHKTHTYTQNKKYIKIPVQLSSSITMYVFCDSSHGGCSTQATTTSSHIQQKKHHIFFEVLLENAQ